LIATGVQIFEGTRMARIRSGSRVRVGTPAGEVESDAVVLAVNAWAMAFPQVRRHMLITASDTVVVPAPQDATDVLADGVGVSDSGRLLNYWRRTTEGHLLFGKGGLAVGYGAGAADRLFRDRVDETTLRDRMGRLLPGVPYRPLFRWRSPVEYSLTSLPFFTQLDGHPRVYLAAGYSGDGVGPSKLGAKILASLALGSRDEWSASPLTRAPTQTLPPEPLRFVGGLIVGRALRRQDQRQAAGRTTDKPTELLTRLDPTSWVS
jgi:glycine/D-amino acid oxidase-like deaminating enzyme